MIILAHSSIGKKFSMAISGIFLIIFLTQHFLINLLSVVNANLFNKVSHYMGMNPFIQFILQPILIFSIIFHFVMGFILEIQNQKSRGKFKYIINYKGNSTWISRNMIFSGLTIFTFLILHFLDFWIYEINMKYLQKLWIDPYHYHVELVKKFHNLWRVIIYIISFIFLGLHLSHGFQSSFQSLGIRYGKYKFFFKKIGIWYSIIIPLGFTFITLYHYFNKYNFI